ncbi:MAG: hypothetical protein WC878_07810 [Candidatus Paceibacterota bacterium]|jgi:hypothetical protein
MANQKNTQKGFMEIITLFIIFCIIVWYFNIDIRGFIDSHPQIKNSLLSFIDFWKRIWNDYLVGAGAYIWNNIIIGIIWKNIGPFVSNK